jgi:hypothetical protein
MTLAEALDIVGTWDEQPPAFLSLARIEATLAAWLGVKRRAAARRPEDLAAWRSRLGSGDVHAGLGGAAVLDFAALKERFRHVG